MNKITRTMVALAAGMSLAGAVGSAAAAVEVRFVGADNYSDVGQFEHFPIQALSLALEVRAESKVYADDVNSEAAPGYAVFNARAGYAFRIGEHRAYAYARLDNILSKRYAGSVIVNESNRRFYEAAPARRLLVGMRTEF